MKRAAAYLSVLEQNGGVETGISVSDIESTMVGHFLLQGTDVCWERRGAQTLLDSCDPFIESFVIVRFR